MRIVLLAGAAALVSTAALANGHEDQCFDKGTLTYFDCPTEEANFTGFYIGMHAGVAGTEFTGAHDTGSPFPPAGDALPLDSDEVDWLFGAHIGASYQFESNFVLGVEADELLTAGLISAAVALGLILKWKDLLLHSFDPAQARAAGLPVGMLHYGLLSALALTIVATLSAVGLILAIGLLIAPGAIAFLLVRTFRHMLWVATLVCLGAMLLGTYLSFHLDAAPAPTIVLVLTALFLAAFLRRQVLNRRASAQRIAQS